MRLIETIRRIEAGELLEIRYHGDALVPMLDLMFTTEPRTVAAPPETWGRLVGPLDRWIDRRCRAIRRKEGAA